jgi:hypothetical protein
MPRSDRQRSPDRNLGQPRLTKNKAGIVHVLIPIAYISSPVGFLRRHCFLFGEPSHIG